MTGALLVASREMSGETFVLALHAFAEAIGVFDYPHPKSWSWDQMPEFSRELCEAIWKWEDVPLRSVKHVLGAFERAIEYATPQPKSRKKEAA